MKSSIITASAIVLAAIFGGNTAAAQQQTETKRMLDRFLSYVKIESQSVDDNDPESFPLTDGQKEIANFIFNEIKSFGGKIDVKMSPYYYIYVKIPSNIKQTVPSVMFMAHLDVTPEANGQGIKPQVHYNYDGGDIALGNGLVLSPKSNEGKHLNDLIGKTIVTSDGTTLLGSDCKAGCAILVSLIEQMVKEQKNYKHGDVYFCFSQNEDVGKAALKMDMSYFDKTPDILYDVDGGNYGEYSMANFTAEGRTYLFKGNDAHPGDGKTNGLADAQTAMAYFIGQLPPEIHPSHSEGTQGYVHCYEIEQFKVEPDIRPDVRLHFRIRYFDKADGELYQRYLDNAMEKTREAYPTVKIVVENSVLQYDNVEYSMHPKAVEIISKAAQITGITMNPVKARGGTTGAMMVAVGMPGGPCIYSGQNAEHSKSEWCCMEELVDLTKLCKNIVTEVSLLK